MERNEVDCERYYDFTNYEYIDIMYDMLDSSIHIQYSITGCPTSHPPHRSSGR